MQTPAEKYLIDKVVELSKEKGGDFSNLQMLNVGAGKSLVLEKGIQAGLNSTEFTFDRMDVIDCQVDHPGAGECFIASAESMPAIESGKYEVAYANYVLEHVEKLDAAASEIARVLKSDGYFITSLPNPRAPEFVLSKYTPTKFHQAIKGEGEGSHAHETHYAYKNIKEFVTVFEKYFTTVEVKLWSFTYGYLHRFPVIKYISKAYDATVNFLRIKPLMGNVCLIFKKTST
ncbi:methyltransferase domain-containing protein [Patescibacteria group bacterium]